MSPTAAAKEEAARVTGEAADPLYRRIFPALGVLSLLTSCVLWSLRKPFAGDELFTLTEISDPSLGHLMRAAWHLGGGAMPLFYAITWTWAHLFGMGRIPLRLCSSLAICGAFLVVWRTLRTRFGARAAFLGTALGLFGSYLVLDQNVEARDYGIYLLLAALAVAQTLRVAETSRPSRRDLALLTLSQAGLVLGHVLGLIYAGLLLAALAAGDGLQGKLRLRVYLWYVAGWLALLPWIPAIQASMAVAKPHSWVPMPGMGDLAMGFSFWLFGGIYLPLFQSHSAGLLAGWLAGLLCVVLLVSAGSARLRSAAAAERPVWLIAFALLLAPAAFFIVSHLVTPIYVARYMIPSAIGVAILAGGWAEQSRLAMGGAGKRMAWALLLLPIAAAALDRPVRLDVSRIERIAAGRPVVCDDINDFLLVARHSHGSSQTEFPLDWPAALAGPPSEGDAYHLMFNYRRAGYLRSDIRDDAQILSQPSFVVLDQPGTSGWFKFAIAGNAQFRWRVIDRIDARRRLIEVERISQP